jgi:putative PIN family toxin of toxin-antitoxin system
MRALLDVNILLSYLLSPHQQSPIHQIVTAGLGGAFAILLPGELLQEMVRKAHGKKYLSNRIAPQELEEFVSILAGLADAIPPICEEIPAVTRDPKDDYLLAYALVGKADYLVTGDEDLLELEQVDTLKIVTAREFLTILETAQPDTLLTGEEP